MPPEIMFAVLGACVLRAPGHICLPALRLFRESLHVCVSPRVSQRLCLRLRLHLPASVPVR
eukprot:6456914-Lingulodinium_polyedra.AAC.1